MTEGDPARRQMMDLAIDEMRLSVRERGKRSPNPTVGAVIVLRDGRVLAAHRAHLRDGEHAEESLLERIADRQEDFEGATAYVTLEPCCPGSRSLGKLSCAERLADARLDTVWIGMMDLNEDINGGGVKYLLNRGVAVHPFPDDLRGVIEDENAGFIESMTAAAAPANEDRSASLLRHAFLNATMDDLDPRALERYKAKLGLVEADLRAVRQRLYEDGTLDGAGPDAHLTGLGVIALASRPRRFIPQAGLNFLVRGVDVELAPVRLDEPGVLIPDMIDERLRAAYPDAYEREHGTGTTHERLPFGAIREGVINAIVHRRWDLTAKSRLFVDDKDQRVTIESPGAPTPPVSLEDLERLDAKPWPRNESLVNLFGDLSVVEESNLGMRTFREIVDSGWPRPVYSMSQETLTLVLFRTTEAAQKYQLDGASWVTDTLRSAWEVIRQRDSISPSEYQRATGLRRTAAFEHLRPFIEHGWLEKDPATGGPTVRYVVRAR